jgi:hypothetical protein
MNKEDMSLPGPVELIGPRRTRGVHTPGPWHLETATCFVNGEQMPPGWTGVSGANWSDFAIVVTRLEDEAFDHAEGVANARLIAAAPELLRVLQFVSTDPCFSVLGSVTREEVREAMAKALGSPTPTPTGADLGPGRTTK